MTTTPLSIPASDRPIETDLVMELGGVTKSFGQIRALDGVTLNLRRGDTLALLGPNGAGKTTSIAVLLGLLRPDEGEVRLFGRAPGVAIAAGRAGAMLQDGGLMGGVRVGELLEMVRRQYRAPMSTTAACELAQLTGFERRLVHRLSGGETQRLRVAVALIGSPELLVLDEPTAAMDVEARHTFWDRIGEQSSAGRTVLFSTHYLEEADEHADRVVVLARGRVVADGTPAAIKASIGFRALRFSIERDPSGFDQLPGVTSVRIDGNRVEVLTSDTDAALRVLLATRVDARDIEVAGIGLEEAFLALTDTAAV